RPAAEAVVELLGRTDGERRRLLGMEGAQAEQVGPGAAQLDVAPHDIRDVGAREQIVDEGLRNQAGTTSCPNVAMRPKARPTQEPVRLSLTRADTAARSALPASLPRSRL